MYEELIGTLRRYGLTNGARLGLHMGLLDAAADAIDALQAENAEKDKEIERLKLHKKCASCRHDLAGDFAICRPCANELDDDIKAALSRVAAERDAAYNHICDQCDILPCLEDECPWWRGAQEGGREHGTDTLC